MKKDTKKQLEIIISGLRLEGYSIKQIKELIDDCLDDVLINERDGKELGKYGG